MSGSGSGRKVVVIGLDGATFRIMRPLLDEGKLPVLRGLMERGASGTLLSTIPPHSSLAWPTFATGKNPGKHGVFYVLHPVPGSYERRLINSRTVRARCVWDLLGARGRKVGLVDIPITFPVRPVNGFLIAGMLTPSEDTLFTYPDDLHMELLTAIGDFPVETETIAQAVSRSPVHGIKASAAFADNRLRAGLHLMKTREWDFFFLVFRGTDLVQHLAWRFMQEELRPLHPELSRKLESAIPHYYRKMDAAVGELLQQAGPEAVTIIMSDHGMGPCRRDLFLNVWLEREGFLRRKPLSIARSRRLRVRRRPLAPPVPVNRPAGRLRRWMAATRVPVPDLVYLGRHTEVDWSRTRAYANWTGGESLIHVNLRGREPQGTVAPGEEYESVRDAIISRLLELRDPWDGERVIERVYKREEIYHGPFLEEAPDLHPVPRGFSYHARGDVRGKQVIARALHRAPSLHDQEGILILSGPGVRPGQAIDGARLLDLAPTILHVMGLPVPDDMDGRVLEEALDPAELAARPVAVEPASSWSGAGDAVFSQSEETLLLDSLRGLGYVS